MARAPLRRLVPELIDRRTESRTARTLAFDVPGWPGHLAGQHVDVTLTAEDGYSTQRSYSLASAPDGDRVELTVQRVPDGEVSPYLMDDLAPGDLVELRGPIGGWFVWRPEQSEPVLLVAGGSGLVPLMSMVRARAAVGGRTPFRLLYSVREPEDRLYVPELLQGEPGLDTAYLYTRAAPPEHPRPVGRLTAADLIGAGWPADLRPLCYVCGPTGFVENAATLLTGLGHDPDRIRTERFGPSDMDGSRRSDETCKDGNALGGPLSEIFAVDLTGAVGRCAGCGRRGPVAQLRVYDRAPGLVARCPRCEQVVLRLVRGEDTAWLDLQGASSLAIPLGES